MSTKYKLRITGEYKQKHETLQASWFADGRIVDRRG